MSRRDRRLLERLTARNRDAYVEAVEKHYRRIYGFLHRLTQNSPLAEDLTQETFTTAWRDLDQFDGRASFPTWLHQVALNVYRQRRRSDHLAVEPLDEEDLETWPDPDPGPLARMEAEELRREVQQALTRLPEIYREVVILRVYQDLKYREIADLLGVPLGTVQYRLHVAFRKLREALRGEVEGHERVVTQSVSEC